ncbi:TetR/AcrR family transcriptional regulator [Streptomyces poriticola]|uniref:TetR/AcrR family transcriptional regulator n=1 Tax=Streptomyces poriticola TaxID=3120506 RepID=UPI002FCDF49D
MSDPRPARRPGGRTARIRADVHRAVDELLREQPATELTIARIAERSGVHLGTLYRRWGSADGILVDVVGERLTARSPVPDTGDFSRDMETYAREAAEDLSGPEGILFLRALVAVRLGNDTEDDLPPTLAHRFDEMQAMLDRAAARGVDVPSAQDVFEIIIAPLVAGLLFGTEPSGPDATARLVDRLHRLTGHRAVG